jgi:hypothetical protein
MTSAVGDAAALTDLLQHVVKSYCLSQESLHKNWRCGYPDTYGPCDCVDEFIADVQQQIAGYVTTARAQAWVEGLEHENFCDGCDISESNPYRSTENTSSNQNE